MFTHILVPTDGSALSLKAAKAAVELARVMKTKLTAVYATAPWMPPMGGEGELPRHMFTMESDYRKASEKEAEKALASIEAVAREAKIECGKLHVIDDQPWNGIINAAGVKKCDLVVMASHGRRGLAGLLLGSETVKVLTHSKIPVLVCR